MSGTINLYFSDVFEVAEDTLDEYGAFNISLITDLPLFIDPFLLFYTEKPEYRQLHDGIINYLKFLKTKSDQGDVSRGLLKSWYHFSEVKQNWLGFSKSGNSGRGLGADFAGALNRNLVLVFRNFGQERITHGTHLEKLCLIRSGVGRDMISDFTTNLIKDYLLTFTQKFAKRHINKEFLKLVSVNRATFSYYHERWMPKRYLLPVHAGDYVILTPKDILTKDETWINHADMIRNFEDIPDAVENESLRALINNYFYSQLPKDRDPSKEERLTAIETTIHTHPELLDYFIRIREDTGDLAESISAEKVALSMQLYVKQFGELVAMLQQHTGFYKIPGNTEEETRTKIEFFKDIIENKGGHRIFYIEGKPIRREEDVQIMFRLTWHYTQSDVSREVNDGRGPADFKISRGAIGKTLVEFKLASNSQLKKNLQKQLEIYEKASDAQVGFKVIVYFTEDEYEKVWRILGELQMQTNPNIYLVDARADNKPSGSKA